MPNILNVKNVNDYSVYMGAPVQHPLVSVIHFDELAAVPHTLNNYSVYGLFMHEHLPFDLVYGCGKFDYRSGTLICVAPGQVGGKEDDGTRSHLEGWALLFHPDLLHGTSLEHEIRNCTFFDYHVNESLHMTAEERGIFEALFRRLKDELEGERDALQDGIVVRYIGLVLGYCMRFYNRQFLTRKVENNDVLMRFDTLLRDYYDSRRQLRDGLPSVKFFADALCMSANYFGDLVRKTTGSNASNYIRSYVVQRAKNLLASGSTVAQVAYELGFEYPQHLSRMFKKQTGMSPTDYCGKIGH